MKYAFLGALALFLSGTVSAQKLDQKAQDFLASLSPSLRQEAQYPLTDTLRLFFHYIPLERKGPTLNDFNETQQAAALDLLKASLSEKGYERTREIMSLELILRGLEHDSRKKPDGSSVCILKDYHFLIFGEPGHGNWGWRFEGHHVSHTFVADAGRLVASTPSFMGTNPGIVPSGPEKGKEVLRTEAELGFALLHSLSKTQLEKAYFSETAPYDVFTTNQTQIDPLDHKGIAYPDLDMAQQELLIALVKTYVARYEWGFADTFWEKIKKAGIENLRFSWAGSMEPGNGHYYSIQGPMLLIEFDNAQNEANHVHTVVRDLTNDFGMDLLKEHYMKEHHVGSGSH